MKINYAFTQTLVETRNFASLHSFLEMSIGLLPQIQEVAAPTEGIPSLWLGTR
ncbi:hypothetical protein [Nostoc sp.]|uniref:hypothetical protein n=1 Tax=Nostoc sp. TaxID=1180 RepID=UPI002FFCAE10